MAIPKYDELFQPLLESLKLLGGSASVSEIDEKIAEILKLSEKDINEVHRGNRTKFSYRLGWARNYLKRAGFIENSERGVWRLTALGQETTIIDREKVKRDVKSLSLKEHSLSDFTEDEVGSGQVQSTWQDDLIGEVYKLSPNAFERLAQRLLRESGFIQVEVTGRSGDGGIDGKGILRLNGFLSFRILFQCKRYSGAVRSREIRDFRGAMEGRADKGLFITTGSFTRDAKQESVRDGATAIDLIDGTSLAEKMKELKLGVITTVEESVKIDENFFSEYKSGK